MTEIINFPIKHRIKSKLPSQSNIQIQPSPSCYINYQASGINFANQGGGQNNRGQNNRYDDRKGQQGGGNGAGRGGNSNRGNLSHWNNEHRNELGGFQNKRRRF